MLNDQLVSNFGLNLSGTLEYLSFPEHYPLTLVFRSDHGQEGNHIKKKLTVCKYHIYSICCYSVEYIDLAKAKSGARIFFFLHVSRSQCLAPARTRTQVVWLRAQRTDHWMDYWTLSYGIGVPAVQLTMHVKSSTLYGHTVVRSYGQIFSAWWVTTILYIIRASLLNF